MLDWCALNVDGLKRFGVFGLESAARRLTHAQISASSSDCGAG